MNKKYLLLLFCPLLIIATRLIPHLPNVVPVTAIALTAGVYLGKKWALVLPLLGLIISDLVIGFYNWQLMMAVYGSFVLIGLISWWLRKNKTTINVITASLLSSTLFFIITNLAVWTFSSWYPKTLTGLLYCFELALPFFRYTLAGDLLYVTLLFASFEFLHNPNLIKKLTFRPKQIMPILTK